MAYSARGLKFALGVVIALVTFFARAAPPAVAQPATTLRLAIVPMQCSVERVNDGIREVVRVTPTICERAVLPN